MTTAVLNEKRYTLSFACLLVALFWAGVMLFSMAVFAHPVSPYAQATIPDGSTVERPAVNR